MNELFLLEEFIKEALIDEAHKKKRKKSKSKKKKSTKYPSQYKAKGKRKKKLDTATKLAKSDSEADRQRAYKMRDSMEKAERKKKGFKNVPRHDSKK
tara:strand:- start:1196 stop:1486 length:291 start_codon:yes stop_codon:yes gene_type:complete